MISRKICMLGSFAVGKTSLVKRFVESIFSEKYKTTIGVQISKKVVTLTAADVQLLIWDIEGADDFIKMKTRYLSGAAGCILVVDGTRPNTAKTANELVELMQQELGDKPFVFLINKHDLLHEWRIDDAQLKLWQANGWAPIFTSAKTGENVELAFHQLAERTLKESVKPT
ncbi:GTP-binding protein [Aliikangiella marina]|uniref:GTP-binding protein n=1 Tax=Aliikangiella marina TaxID=1712262 RepID=A0A545TJ83_9GAMM|nr:Rab family GTPase [Aliikangiella marina]TQV77275.1 GTP-binding protein [Aliikangiella marina]